MKGKRNNNNFEYEDQRQTFRLSPLTTRRDRINPKMRVALILHCLCGYSQSDAYAIAFNYRGSPNSLAPIASRFFNAPGSSCIRRTIREVLFRNTLPCQFKILWLLTI